MDHGLTENGNLYLSTEIPTLHLALSHGVKVNEQLHIYFGTANMKTFPWVFLGNEDTSNDSFQCLSSLLWIVPLVITAKCYYLRMTAQNKVIF